MTTVTSHPFATEISQAIPLMIEQIEAVLLDVTPPDASPWPKHLRLVVQIPLLDPLEWLQIQTVAKRIYWSDREAAFAMAGIGIADQEKIDPKLWDPAFSSALRGKDAPESGATRYFGGYRFGRFTHVADQTWSSLGAGRFVLPRFELYSANEQAWFVCNLIPERDRKAKAKILRQLSQVLFIDEQQSSDLPKLLERIDLPNRKDWDSGVRDVLTSVADGELSKVVLARRSTLLFDEAPDPVRVLRRLKARSSGCYHFLFQFDSAAAFIGASPELLFRRTGRRLESEAVAGTRPRGVTADEDIRMERELIGSEKEIIEHRFVVDDIKRVMQQLCQSWKVLDNGDGDSLMKLARVQHLITRLEGQLDNGRSDLDIVSMLHPTSAVGGAPTTRAMQMIEELEPFDRGWYAAPVGWLGGDSAEFAVAIRSGLVAGRTVHLFSGAGIVDGSSAEDEWREIDSKLANFLAALS